jgi:hypothetical protein
MNLCRIFLTDDHPFFAGSFWVKLVKVILVKMEFRIRSFAHYNIKNIIIFIVPILTSQK